MKWAAYSTDQSAKYELELEVGQVYKVLGNAPEYLADEIKVSPQKAGEELFQNILIELEPLFERDTSQFLFSWISVPIHVLDAETHEKIDTPKILIYTEFDTLVFKIFESYYLEYNSEILFDHPRLAQNLSYRTEINAPGYKPQTVYFRFPRHIEEAEITVYLKKLR